MEWILLVTWIVSKQPPNSYQVTYASESLCAAARDAVLADGQRIIAKFEQTQTAAAQSVGVSPALMLAGNIPPAVTAVCTQKNGM